MNAKEYLLQIQKLDKVIEDKLADIAHWKAVATKATNYPSDEKVQSSEGKQKMADAVCKYVDEELELYETLKLLTSKRKEIFALIESLPTHEYKLLNKVYAQGKYLYEVAIEIDKSYRWVKTVHKRALANVQRILDERSENEN